MKPVWVLAAVLVGCSGPPPTDAGGSTTAAVATTMTTDDPTVAGTSDDDPTTTTTTATTATTTGETTVGEACNPSATACTGEQAWLRAFPVTGDDFFGNPIEAATLSVAPDGDIVATGMYGGTIEFGDQSIASVGALDLWVARFGADGAPKWFRRFGGPDPTPDEGYSGANWSDGNIAFDVDGDILVTAKCVDTIDFGFGPLVGDDLDPIVLRLSSSGQPKWAHRHVGLGGGNTEFPVFISPVGDGRVWLAGTLYGPSIDLGGGLLGSAGWGDIFLAQFDAEGNHLWSRRAGDPGHQEVRAIASAPDGGLVIAGGLEGSVDLGAGPLISAGTRDAFVALLANNGEATWSHRYGDNNVQSSLAVKVDKDGGILLAGDFQSAIDLGGGPLDPSAGLFIAGLGADGSHVWSTAIPAIMTSLDRGGAGELVFGGFGTPSLTFPNGVWGSGKGPWVATFGPDASPRWQRILSDDEYSIAHAVAGPNGAAIVAVTIFGEVEFDGKTVGTPDQQTFILAQFGL